MISTHQRMKAYCSEPLSHIENYQEAVNDNGHLWVCHHRGEILPCGRYTVAQLQKYGMYWHRPASELIFLRQDAHCKLHHKGTYRSNEAKRRIAEKMKLKMMGRGKKVEMTRLVDNRRVVFSSMSEAARWLRENGYPKADKAHIRNALKRNQHSCGAKWRITHD